jgi:prepilin signal peptidase PulO-like enzyme (type II secretory pathway)
VASKKLKNTENFVSLSLFWYIFVPFICHILWKYECFKIKKKIKFFLQVFEMAAIFKMAEKQVF